MARASDLREHTTELGGSAQLAGVSSFGVDASGELYIVSYSRGVPPGEYFPLMSEPAAAAMWHVAYRRGGRACDGV